ncbi:MAG: hypothetical protein IKP86_11430 [Anaerolineaceae bacterium]|nr:hypothetical protein [Anaerolineaceae bacterium]
MKKSTILILFVLAAMILGITAAVSAESRTEYYGKIYEALTKLRYALQDSDKQAANTALGEVRTHVYAGMRYLAKIGAYDARAMAIVDNANKAYTACFNGLSYEEFLNEAFAFDYIVFGSDLPPVEEESSHS